MEWREAEYQRVEIECDGSRCPEHNVVVYPEIIGTGEIKVGLLGEAPFIEEEIQKRPFVGSSGQIIREYLDLESCTYYIFNSVSCLTYREGETLKPSKMGPEEYEARLTACRPFRQQVLDLLDDGSVIVALGKFAIHAMFGDWSKRASTVPDFLEIEGKTYIVYSVYHPAYPLYRPSAYDKFEELLEATGVLKVERDNE
jgi:DNA polymerase